MEDGRVGNAQAGELGAQDGGHFSRCTTAQLRLVFLENNQIRMERERSLRQFADIGVGSIAGMPQQ